jgi:MOSC domain-containing protein YiiM
MTGVPRVVSVNLGVERPSEFSTIGVTGIDKQPVEGPVEIRAPGPGAGGGLAGDAICDRKHHGRPFQAVYAYAREDLDHWESELARTLRCGMFGENLTTGGLDVTGALVGERWRVGDTCVLQVAAPRIPCRTFAGWLAEQGWVRRFTEAGRPGAYLGVVVPGPVRPGDAVTVAHRPDHHVTIGLTFLALTTESQLLPEILAAGDTLPAETRERALRHT